MVKGERVGLAGPVPRAHRQAGHQGLLRKRSWANCTAGQGGTDGKAFDVFF